MMIAALGSNGMLGHDFCDLAGDVHKFDLPEWDATKSSCLSLCSDYPIIVNCAAFTDVEAAERNETVCRQVNSVFPGHLGLAAKETGSWILHISTDFVFGSSGSESLDEYSPTKPLNAYGRSKLDGEIALIESGCNCCILRIQWTYGHHGNNFIKKIIKSIDNQGYASVVDDQFGSPTWTYNVAMAMIQLMSKRSTGLWHFASRGFASRYDVAKHVAKVYGKGSIIPCKSSEFKTAAQRPMNSRFNCAKIESLGINCPDWKESLDIYLKELH
jgi:dTDP-4-dehydrorhamnose reductase